MVADDLTGAADAALALAERGFSAEIAAPLGAYRPPRRAQAWVLDTESRALPPRAAARRVRRAVQALRRWGADVLYKKIDSTLRGPLGAEMAAFQENAGADSPLWVVPAFPKAGRTVARGLLRVDGVLLHRTPFARDPRHPRRVSRVASFLKGPKRGWVVPDIENDTALHRAARAAAGFSALAGSAGFLSALAARWGRGRKARWVPGRGVSSAVVVAGSAHPRTRGQLDYLGARQKRGGGPRRLWVFGAPAKRGNSTRVLRGLLRSLRSAPRAARWVVTGGETAFGLIQSWHQPRWRVAGRVDTGVPLCRSVGGPRRELVMKPGGFGKKDVFWKALTLQ